MTKKILFISLILFSLVQLAVAQKAISPAKKKLVANLTANTSAIFPAEEVDSLFKTVQSEKMAENAKGITDLIVTRIDSSSKLNAQEKDEIKAKVHELTDKLSEMSMNLMGKDFAIKTWTNESFQKYYSSKFTISELRKLNTYFQTANGKQIARIFKALIIGGITDDKKPSDTQNDALMENFLKKSFAEKFFNVLLENIIEEIMRKTDAQSKKASKEINKSLENGAMKKLLEDFIAANIKE